MSVPIAGRRKGLNPASSPSAAPSVPASQAASCPSWLSTIDNGAIGPAPPGAVTASTSTLPPFSPSVSAPLSVAVETSSAVGSPVRTATVFRATEHDSLDFLNEIEKSPATASPKPEAGHPSSTQGNVHEVALLDCHSQPPAPCCEPMASPPSRSVPVFLRYEGGDSSAAASATPMAADFSFAYSGAVTTASPAALHPSEETDIQQTQKATLSQELIDLDRQLDEGKRRVEELQRGLHPLTVEVSELERTLVSLRSTEATAREQKRKEEAEIERRVRESAVSATASRDTEEEMREYRRECTQRHQQQIEDLTQAVQAQQSTNLTLRAEFEAAATQDTSDELQASVIDALLLGVQDGVRHLKRRLALQCRDAVVRSAREHLSAARQQRADIFANDAEARAKTMAQHRSRREAEAAAFQDTCRRTFQERADSALGVFKITAETAHRQHNAECSQRLAAFQSQLASMTERSCAMLEQEMRRGLETKSAIAITQRDAAAKELSARQEDLAAQHRVFRSRAEAEVRALRESREIHRTFIKSPSRVPVSTAPTVEEVHSELDRVRIRMEQLVLLFRSRREHKLSLLSPGGVAPAVDYNRTSGMRDYGNSHVSSSSSVQQLSGGWQHSLSSLQHSREALQRSISDVKELTCGWASQLQHRRMQATEQRAVVKAVCAEWEQTIRGQLSRCLTSTSSPVPVNSSLTTGLLRSVNQRFGDVMSAQQSLRAARAAFTEELGTWSQSLTSYRVETERLLADTFQKLDLLRERSLQAKVDQLTLQSLHAQVDALEHHVMEEANQLDLRKEYVDAIMKNRHVGSALLHLPENWHSSQSLPPMPKGHAAQSMQNSSNTKWVSAARGESNPAAVVGLGSDPDHQMRRGKKRATSSFVHKNVFSATAVPLVTRTSSLASHRAREYASEGPRAAIADGSCTVKAGQGDIDLFGSRSPSPIGPAAEVNRTYVFGESVHGVAGDTHAPIHSAAHETLVAADTKTVRPEGRETDSSTDVVALGDIDRIFLGSLYT
ncbi:hypothetical protein JKF63_00881 [Porcisia hertigi]|uniref:L6202.3-like protein n=1 Tax=Porcisia hertigi TaxID=2761500 RepID=A0A836KXK7_9TRYP|nr:hypothetical protein JKF63_00881 [Porcisia hertigi]